MADTPHNLPPNAPLPVKQPHPLRHAINGDTHLIGELKTIIQGKEIDATLKQWICEELDEITTNAATVHLHVLDLIDGSVTIDLHIKPVVLGSRG